MVKTLKPSQVRRSEQTKKARNYLSQQDVPTYSLHKALTIPLAITENYGNGPATPLELADALKVSPRSGAFRMLTGAAVTYGLTTGGYGVERIGITPLGVRIVKPTVEGDDVIAKRESLLKPRVLREFLHKYENAPIPRDDIARNVLTNLGVPKDRISEVLQLVLDGAESVGFIRNIKDKKYIDLKGANAAESPVENAEEVESKEDAIPAPRPGIPEPVAPTSAQGTNDARAKKVFITHGKNKNFVEPIKGLLSYGELEPVVATESQTASLPVPLKIMGHMRSCGAAIIHVEGERKLFDADSKEVVGLNENVLIEIGAAMALYGDRFILLVKDGVKLPSNLQGIYEVRYTGEMLDANDTVKLLGAIKDMKNRPLP